MITDQYGIQIMAKSLSLLQSMIDEDKIMKMRILSISRSCSATTLLPKNGFLINSQIHRGKREAVLLKLFLDWCIFNGTRGSFLSLP